MQEEPKQQYGLFVPKLNAFMYIQATRTEFEKILQEYSLDPKGSYKVDSPPPQQEKFDDFDKVVD